jgi:hypothetical protein
VLITAALVLSGCAGKSDVKGGDGGVPPVAPSGQLSEDTCAIEGLVTDEEFNPLPGAQVGILDLGDKKTTSAADGGFSFSFLEPGSYQLAATKPGYDPDVKRVTCEAGAKATTQLSLIRIPDPLVSYARIYPVEKGHIGCSVGFLSFSTDDFCKTTGINPNGRNKMTYKPDPYQVTSMIMEVDWVPSGTFGGQFLSVIIPGWKAKNPEVILGDGDSIRQNVVKGTPPIQLTVRSTLEDPLYHYVSESATMEFQIRAAGSNQGAVDPTQDGSSKLVLSQDFNFYLGLYYLDEPLPDGFTLLE